MRRGPGVPSPYQYIGATARSAPGGWESLGDIGHVDADGYVYITDRLADMILVGGANVYPAEIEAALDEHPAVRSCCVIGLPDEDGYSLIGRVRAMHGAARRIPAIALTAYAGHEDRQHALDAGYHVHFSKPVELDALLAAIEDLKPAIQLR